MSTFTTTTTTVTSSGVHPNKIYFQQTNSPKFLSFSTTLVDTIKSKNGIIYKNGSLPNYRKISAHALRIPMGKEEFQGSMYQKFSFAMVPLNPKQFKTLIFNESLDYHGIINLTKHRKSKKENSKSSFKMLIVTKNAWNDYDTEAGKSIRNIKKLLKAKLPCTFDQTFYLAKGNKLISGKYSDKLFLAPLFRSKENSIIAKIFGNENIVKSF